MKTTSSLLLWVRETWSLVRPWKNEHPRHKKCYFYHLFAYLFSAKLNVTTGGPYTYDISSHRFSGTGYDGSWIDTTSACSGQSGSCRNNPSCTCQKNVGPLPTGTYTLGNMMTFKGMPYCYQLYPSSSNNMCGRSGFLIHGGDCSGNPSEGCIVISNQNTRYLIKSGATLKVVA